MKHGDTKYNPHGFDAHDKIQIQTIVKIRSGTMVCICILSAHSIFQFYDST